MEERRNAYTQELSGSHQGSILLSGLQKTKLRAVIWCNLVIAPNRGIYNVIFLGFSCLLSIEEILKNVFIYFSKLIFINLLFISHFPKSQKSFWLFLQKHCLKLRFHFNISAMWAVHWWFLLLGLARKTFHFIHIPFFKHLFWETKLKWQNNDRLKNSHYPIWGLMALPHMECGMFTFF